MLLHRFDGSLVSSKVFHSLNNYHVVRPTSKDLELAHPMTHRKQPKAWTDFSKAKEKNHDLTYEQFINNQKDET